MHAAVAQEMLTQAATGTRSFFNTHRRRAGHRSRHRCRHIHHHRSHHRRRSLHSRMGREGTRSKADMNKSREYQSLVLLREG
jgi:hypothetical protein